MDGASGIEFSEFVAVARQPRSMKDVPSLGQLIGVTGHE
jgi:hypothetical protein